MRVYCSRELLDRRIIVDVSWDNIIYESQDNVISVDKCWDNRIMSLMSRDNVIDECWDNVIDESSNYDIDVSQGKVIDGGWVSVMMRVGTM